jgi:hypothetical protein
MTRFVRLLAACAVCVLAACGDDAAPDTVKITLFQAAPNAIEAGQTTQLLFVVDPPDAAVEITGIGDVTGTTQAVITPAATTVYHLTATQGKATDSRDVTVTVGPQAVAGLRVEPSTATPIAGQPVTVTLTAITAAGKPAPSFRGTVHLVSTDAKAELPADVAFTVSDAGVKQVAVTLEAAGTSTLIATDVAAPTRQGSASVTVQPAAAATCTAAQAPALAVAGSLIGVDVVVHDAFGNVATGYTGTIRLTATDVRAAVPPDVTYLALDAGSHVFSTQLLTTGLQTLTATDTTTPAIQCTAVLTVTPAAARFVLAIPANANAGYPVTVGVAVADIFDNPIPGYTGTVSFVSSDAGTGAVAPPAITFTGAENGVATTAATFVSLGVQSLTATDSNTPTATGSATSAVHGLVYTPPAIGRVRFAVNAAQSTTQIVQLDLVANERLETSSFFGGGPGSFAVGMNLPLDTTRVGADATLLTAGNALRIGGATPVPPVAVAAIGATDHVLYTAVSRKRVAGTVFTQETEVQAGQVFYSVRLKLQPAASVGPIFDGGQPSPLYRAAVRDQYGDDFVNQGEFGVGRLEVR